MSTTFSNRGGNFNFKCVKGKTFILPLTVTDPSMVAIDLTDCHARFTWRETPTSTPAWINVTDATGEIVIDGAEGTITITLSDTVTAGLTAGTGVYELEYTDNAGNVAELLYGSVTIVEESTYLDN